MAQAEPVAAAAVPDVPKATAAEMVVAAGQADKDAADAKVKDAAIVEAIKEDSAKKVVGEEPVKKSKTELAADVDKAVTAAVAKA